MATSYSERDGLRNQPSFSVTWRTVGRSMRVPSAKNADRQPRIVHPFEPKLLVGLHVIAQLDPLEWDVTSLEKVANGVSGGTTALAIEADGASLLHGKTSRLRPARIGNGNHYQSIPSAAQLRHSA